MGVSRNSSFKRVKIEHLFCRKGLVEIIQKVLFCVLSAK